MSLDDVLERGKGVDLYTIESDDQLLVLPKGDLIGSRPGIATLANAFADVERHTASGAFIWPRRSAPRKLGDNLAHLTIEL